MTTSIRALQEENEELRRALVTLRESMVALQDSHEETLLRLTAELALLKKKMFGPKAERLRNAEAQLALFKILEDLGRLQQGDVDAGDRADAMLGEMNDEADESAAQAEQEPKSARLPEVQDNVEKKKRKHKTRSRPHGRRNLDESVLPKETIVIEPLERSLPGGEDLVLVGKETTRHIDHRPASLVVVVVERPKYMRLEDAATSAAERNGQAHAGVGDEEVGTTVVQSAPVFMAEPPELPISKGLAGPGLLALVLVMKYADHLPLHRQERIFRRQGLHMPRSTLCGFVQGCTALLRRITDAMWLHTKEHSPILFTDACGVLVQQKDKCRRGHFQVFVAPTLHVFFSYLRANTGDAVADLLAGFSGTLQCDASSVYHETYRLGDDVLEAGCWAHARRGFFRALLTDRARALIGIGFISRLYDAHYASIDTGGVCDGEKRRALAEPLLTDLRSWIDAERPQVVVGSLIDKALGYCQRQWEALTLFLEDGRLLLDNNTSERALREQVVGAKNWLFCGSDGGAEWNAVIVSLVASCRMHDIEPCAYLRDVLTLLPSWKASRTLELAPLFWKETRQQPEVLEKLKRLQLISYDIAHPATSSPPSAA